MLGLALATSALIKLPQEAIAITQIFRPTLSEQHFEAQRYLYYRLAQHADKHGLPLDTIAPLLIADNEDLSFSFPVEKEEIIGPNIVGCVFTLEYPQISGLANKEIQNQLNESLKSEILRRDRWPRRPGDLGCNDPLPDSMSDERKMDFLKLDRYLVLRRVCQR